jgi:hypothetical protein
MKYFLLATLCILSLFTAAQKKKSGPIAPVQQSPDSLFSNLKWRNIGPFRGGRANAISGVVGNDQKFYAGYTGGGVTITGSPAWNAPTATNSSITAGTAFTTPTASITYTTVTLATAFDAVLIYNSTQSNTAVSVHTFGSQTITAGTFTLTMPANTTAAALLRIATT